ncbi:MAG: hypothetical protein U5K76_15695 [Woeseiaceae bacterium]|nr:hypothetical protein [Woeseiaceae bacterium]
MQNATATSWLLLLCAGAMPLPAQAQAEPVNTVPWAYATWFGTGWYEIGDERDAFALRIVPRVEWREAALSDDGERRVGIHFRFPVTVGLNQFPLDDLAGSVDPDNLANISVTPGIYFDVPVSERWSLRPFAAAGWGSVLNGSDSAWTYWAGIKSRWRLTDGSPELALINAAGFVGYSPDEGRSEQFWPLETALELTHPVAELDEGNDRLQLVWHVKHTHFHGSLDLLDADGTGAEVNEQWELGLAFARRDAPIRIWRLEFDRLGLAYRLSSGGGLRGVGLIFRSLFDE